MRTLTYDIGPILDGCIAARYRAMTAPSLAGWDISDSSAAPWVPWGQALAQAKVLATADGYVVAVVEADAGYQGSPHEHAHAEFLYVLDGEVHTQGRVLHRGDAYAAAAGSTHTDFSAEAPVTYLSIFRL